MANAPTPPPDEGTDERDNDRVLVEHLAGLRRLAQLQRRPALRRRWVRVALFLTLFLAPILLALVTVRVFPDEPTEQLLTAEALPAGEPGVAITLTLRNLDADAGEVLGGATFAPTDAIARRGVLDRPVTVRFDDARGESRLVFPANDVMSPAEVRLRLEGSRATEYPFDHYGTDLVASATYGPPERAVPMRVSLDLRAVLTQFTAAAEPEASVLASGVATRLNVERSLGVVVWAVMFMVIAWSLGLACMGLTWSSLTHLAVIPFWHWGLFAAVLFALPNIRDALPGDPPFGSVVDWGAYYWAVVMVATALLVLVLAWLITVRRGEAPV